MSVFSMKMKPVLFEKEKKEQWNQIPETSSVCVCVCERRIQVCLDLQSWKEEEEVKRISKILIPHLKNIRSMETNPNKHNF